MSGTLIHGIEKYKVGQRVSEKDYERMYDSANYNMIKVNLPTSEEQKKNCNGEGIWALVTKEDYDKHSDNTSSDQFYAIASNWPIMWNMEVGTVMPCHFNKDKRPTCDYEWLKENYSESEEEENNEET